LSLQQWYSPGLDAFTGVAWPYREGDEAISPQRTPFRDLIDEDKSLVDVLIASGGIDGIVQPHWSRFLCLWP